MTPTSIWKYNPSRMTWDHMRICLGQDSADSAKRRYERVYPGMQFCISEKLPSV